jgi:hypothetical protein
MKTKLILLSLLFIGLSHNTSAGCGKSYLSITGKATLSYDYWQDPGPVTVFVNADDSSELRMGTIGHCFSSRKIISIVLNGAPVPWTGIDRTKIRNNLGLYEVRISFVISAITYTQAMSFYFSPQAAVGIEEAGEVSADLLLAPNPASGQFRIESTASIRSVSVFDLAGRQLNFVESHGNGLSIPLDNYPRGIYLVKVVIEPDKIALRKLMVQ